MGARRNNNNSRRPKALTTLAACALAAVAALSAPRLAAAAATCDKTLAGGSKYDAVAAWDKTCNEARNWECKEACQLWNEVARPARGNKLKFAYSGTKNKAYRGKILPSEPVTGIESIVAGQPSDPADQATYFLWKQALGDIAAQAPALKNKIATPARYPVAYINSLVARTQHQMHIHVGQPTSLSKFYSCAKSVITSPPTAVWSKPLSGGACVNLQAGNMPVSLIGATVGPNDVNKAIRAGFAQVMGAGGSAVTTNKMGTHSGVLVMPVAGSKNLLVFIVTGTDDYKIFGDTRA